MLECALYNSIKDRLPLLFENVVPGSLESSNLALKLILAISYKGYFFLFQNFYWYDDVYSYVFNSINILL